MLHMDLKFKEGEIVYFVKKRNKKFFGDDI